MGNYITVKVSDGTEMRVYVSRPSSLGKHPGIVVYHEAFGVNPHIRDVADRFAREGYVAIAPELFHRTGVAVEGDYNDFAGMQKHFTAIKEELVEADVRASYDWLIGDSSVDVNRYCLHRLLHGGTHCVPDKHGSSGESSSKLLWRRYRRIVRRQDSAASWRGADVLGWT